MSTEREDEERGTYRVGEMMIAPISRFPSGLSRLNSFSNTGMTKARVLPDPVTACGEDGERTVDL
jgi:hypothetical protein